MCYGFLIVHADRILTVCFECDVVTNLGFRLGGLTSTASRALDKALGALGANDFDIVFGPNFHASLSRMPPRTPRCDALLLGTQVDRMLTGAYTTLMLCTCCVHAVYMLCPIPVFRYNDFDIPQPPNQFQSTLRRLASHQRRLLRAAPRRVVLCFFLFLVCVLFINTPGVYNHGSRYFRYSVSADWRAFGGVVSKLGRIGLQASATQQPSSTTRSSRWRQGLRCRRRSGWRYPSSWPSALARMRRRRTLCGSPKASRLRGCRRPWMP